MLNIVIVMLKGTARIERWINIYTLNRTCKFLFKRFKCEEIIAQNEAVIEEVMIRDAMLSVM